jgi:hypothetical protein
MFAALCSAFALSSRDAFRLLHFSVQRDHIHLLVEADEPLRLTRGLQGLAIRAAKSCNRALGRCGSFWADRYHSRSLATPREVRNALVYVLANVKKHVPGTPSPVARARTWLARVGWRRHGLIDVEEAPRAG